MAGGFAQPAFAPAHQKRAPRRGASNAASTFTVAVGEGEPIVLGHVRDGRDWDRLLASLRHVFDNEEARAEGWSTSALPDGFLASRGGRAVTFQRHHA